MKKVVLKTANQDYAEINVKILRIISGIYPALTLLVSLGTLIVIWFGGKEVIDDSLTVGQIVAVMNYLATTLAPLMILGMLAGVIASGVASAERVDEVLYEKPDILESPVLSDSRKKLKAGLSLKMSVFISMEIVKKRFWME